MFSYLFELLSWLAIMQNQLFTFEVVLPTVLLNVHNGYNN